jgi:hypothetical protein
MSVRLPIEEDSYRTLAPFSCYGVVAPTYNTAMARSPIAVVSVRNLQANGKRLLEDILGQQLKQNQQVFIMAFTPGIVPSDKDRDDARAGLKQTWWKVDQHMKEHGITEEQFDAAIDEAVEQVRHRNK